MFPFGLNPKLSSAAVKRGLLLAIGSLLVVAGLGTAVPSTAKDKQASKTADPEVLLFEVYKEIAANNLHGAQSKADTLVAAYPKFRLGHLIRGDLLLMHVRPVTSLGAAPDGKGGDALKDLREEAMMRLKALGERPAPDLLPRPVLQLRSDQKRVLVIDTRRSRLYVYENRSGRPTLVSDYYVSQGKLGADKFEEGDLKTPLGVYYITGRMSPQRLPDFYGSGALPVNYPNEWDRLRGRGGSGIWLHGAPPDTFSRPPLASEGCIVLANSDLRALYTSVEINKTPVVISDSLEFVDAARWKIDRELAARLVEDWRRDVESGDRARLKANYSPQFKSERGEDLATWFEKQLPSPRGVKRSLIRLRDTSLFFYPGRDEVIVATFTQDMKIGKRTSSERKRQYWVNEGERWKIVFEIVI